jgi:acyl-phosphate glycerol 3-phosphate acyltransferase
VLSIAFGLGYLLGSIPFGLLLTHLAGLGDVRQIGSGNIGATNVLRTGHKGLAAATLICDAAKGSIAVLIANSLFGPTGAMLAGLGALLGGGAFRDRLDRRRCGDPNFFIGRTGRDDRDALCGVVSRLR